MSLGLFRDRFPSENLEREAKHYLKKNEKAVKCLLCPHGCEIQEGQSGKCLVRGNKGGKLYATTYGRFSVLHLDPIEKKPLFHFYPTYNILSIGGVGCNLSCRFCQNWELVEGIVPIKRISSREIVDIAVELKSRGNIGIAFTYNEPTIWFEFIEDTAKLVKKETPELKVVLVTNGYMSLRPFEELSEYIDAMNIDLKFARDETYREVSGAHLKPVVTLIERAYKKLHKTGKPFIEVTYLIIPGLNDKDDDIRKLTDIIASISDQIPLHISRFYPNFLMTDVPPTPVETLERAYEIARSSLKFVYVGNLWGHRGENTYCPNCKSVLIARYGFSSSFKNLDRRSGRCKVCNYEFFGVVDSSEGK